MLNYCEGNEFDLHNNTQLIFRLNGCARFETEACSNSKMGYYGETK